MAYFIKNKNNELFEKIINLKNKIFRFNMYTLALYKFDNN